MHFPARFYRVAAVASWLSVLTTLGLIFLPRLFPAVGDFAARMALVHDPAYQLRAWIYLLHPFLAFTAALAVALRLRAMHPGWMLAIVAGFGLWAVTEAAQQAMTLAMFDRWRLAWDGADTATRALIEQRAALYDGAWDAMYFLLLVGFTIGNLASAAALRDTDRLGRVLAVFYVLAALLTISILVGERGGPTLPAPLGFWIYPLVQPLARTLIGAWLWRHADERRALT